MCAVPSRVKKIQNWNRVPEKLKTFHGKRFSINIRGKLNNYEDAIRWGF